MALLALIAATVSYLHMHMLVELHGQPGWVAALTPFSVDRMIAAASTTLLADSRSGSRGAMLLRALLVVGSVASLPANVAVAEPSATGRVIAAWRRSRWSQHRVRSQPCVWPSRSKSVCRIVSRPASAETVISTPVPRLERAVASCPPARIRSSAATAREPTRAAAERKMFPAPSVTAGRKAASAYQRERSLPAPAASAARARLTHGHPAATLIRNEGHEPSGRANPPLCSISRGGSQSLDHGSTRSVREEAWFAPVLTLRELLSSVLNTWRHSSRKRPGLQCSVQPQQSREHGVSRGLREEASDLASAPYFRRLSKAQSKTAPDAMSAPATSPPTSDM